MRSTWAVHGAECTTSASWSKSKSLVSTSEDQDEDARVTRTSRTQAEQDKQNKQDLNTCFGRTVRVERRRKLPGVDQSSEDARSLLGAGSFSGSRNPQERMKLSQNYRHLCRLKKTHTHTRGTPPGLEMVHRCICCIALQEA